MLSKSFPLDTHSSIQFGISQVSDGDTGASGSALPAKLGPFLAAGMQEPRLLIGTQVHSYTVATVKSSEAGFEVSRFEGSWTSSVPGQDTIASFKRLPGSKLSFEVRLAMQQRFRTEEFPNSLAACDGFLTDCDALVPAVSVADCLPIALWAKLQEGNLIRGMLHSGWQGTGILYCAAVALERIWNIEANHAAACIGPGICGSCYRVDRQRADLTVERFGAGVASLLPARPDWPEEFGLDLIECNLRMVSALGLTMHPPLGACTMEDALLWSHRRFLSNRSSTSKPQESIDGRGLAFLASSKLVTNTPLGLYMNNE